MPTTRKRFVSITFPGPTSSSHHPRRGSLSVAVTCRDAEIPPRTTTTGATRGPAISKAKRDERFSKLIVWDSGATDATGSLKVATVIGRVSRPTAGRDERPPDRARALRADRLPRESAHAWIRQLSGFPPGRRPPRRSLR